ncbi:MAG: hypothetical protein WB420_19705, partial [Bradyrhizobium sp.]
EEINSAVEQLFPRRIKISISRRDAIPADRRGAFEAGVLEPMALAAPGPAIPELKPLPCCERR